MTEMAPLRSRNDLLTKMFVSIKTTDDENNGE